MSASSKELLQIIDQDMLIPVPPLPGESHRVGYLQDASFLGWKPGEFPTAFRLKDADTGNPIMERRTLVKASNPNSGWTYRDAQGIFRIYVLNG